MSRLEDHECPLRVAVSLRSFNGTSIPKTQRANFKDASFCTSAHHPAAAAAVRTRRNAAQLLLDAVVTVLPVVGQHEDDELRTLRGHVLLQRPDVRAHRVVAQLLTAKRACAQVSWWYTHARMCYGGTRMRARVSVTPTRARVMVLHTHARTSPLLVGQTRARWESWWYVNDTVANPRFSPA